MGKTPADFHGYDCVTRRSGTPASGLPICVPFGTFLIADDSKCSRPISVVRCIVQGRSQEFVDVRNLVVGYLSTISEKTFGVVRTGSSEHEIDKHPLRS